jgi:S1-C subfamily serine protease
LSRYDFFKKFTQDVTVINRTEVFVKEETSLERFPGSRFSVVNIASLPETEQGAAAKKNAATAPPKNGTGVIVTSDGLVMTYASAILQEKSKYKVITADGNSYDAEFLGTDSYSNLSFLKISANNLSAISLGDSNDSRPGEKVIAVGNNFGNYSNRYAAGLLSSFNPTYNLAGKTVSFSDKLEGVFETDFNSEKNYLGGPVVDYTGQAIGITGSVEKSGGVEYFQIPSNKAKKVIDRAIRKELDKNPALGVYYVPITKTYALNNGLSVDKGALIFFFR